MRHIRRKARLAIVIAGILFPWMGSVSAQLMPIPDDTLGEESSTLRPISPDYPGDVIEGGSRQGNTLFHSFEAFHVEAGRAIYFDDPGVDNILSRVTGGVESQILGLLGVFGDADLFLINPNGIIFGRSARLDLRGGSLLATTADAVELNIIDTGLPNEPRLTIWPSAFLFNQANPAAIVNNSRTLPPTGLDSAPGGGLRVTDGERITLLGGNVSLDGGGLSALGGRMEMGGISKPGAVTFNRNGGLEFPSGIARADVSIANGSRLVASDFTISGGSVAVTAHTLEILNGSGVSAGTVGESELVGGQSGDITLDASQIRVVDSTIDNIVRSRSGDGGNVLITTDDFFVSGRGGSGVQSTLLGAGSAGRVEINARDRITMDGGIVFSNLGGSDRTLIATGSAGNIEITTLVLLLKNGAQLASGTFGRGDAGDVIINAPESVTLENSAVFSGVFTNQAGIAATGDGGNIQITTSVLSLTDVAQLSSRTDGVGNAGNIQMTTTSLSLNNDARVFADTRGRGDGGDITIETQDRTILDQSGIVSSLGQLSESTIFLGSADDARSAGNVQITTGSLDIVNGAQLQLTTSGRGNAGDVAIRARDYISIDGALLNDPRFSSAILASTDAEAQGRGGNVSLMADSVRLSDNGVISTTTSNRFPGGNVTVDANSLELAGGGQIETGTRGDGRAGNIDLEIASQTILTGTSAARIDNGLSFFSGLFANTAQNSAGVGGTVRLATQDLQVLDQARIEVDSQGRGTAGNMAIAANTVRLDNGRLTAETASVNGGNIALENLDVLLLRNGSLISTTAGTDGAGGNGGNIDIESATIVSVSGENNDILANAFSGSGGNVRIDTSGLIGIAAQSQDNLLTNDITASSEQGIQGTVDVATPETDLRSGLAELPVAFTDVSNQITQTCSGNRDGQDSEFVVTGRGGLPQSPVDALVGNMPASEWATLDESVEATDSISSALPDPTLATPNGIVEAQGWVRENGRVKLVAASPTSAVQTAVACQ